LKEKKVHAASDQKKRLTRKNSGFRALKKSKRPKKKDLPSSSRSKGWEIRLQERERERVKREKKRKARLQARTRESGKGILQRANGPDSWKGEKKRHAGGQWATLGRGIGHGACGAQNGIRLSHRKAQKRIKRKSENATRGRIELQEKAGGLEAVSKRGTYRAGEKGNSLFINSKGGERCTSVPPLRRDALGGKFVQGGRHWKTRGKGAPGHKRSDATLPTILETSQKQ